jgi:c-di-GMP-binding flagellar brake protein YcgR
MLRTEQRTHPRITTRITIQSVGPTLNISAGGMCVLTADPLREGLMPEVSFELPDDPTPITCKARIAWCRTSRIDPELFEIGLAFTQISDPDRRRIMQFVETHLTPQNEG